MKSPLLGAALFIAANSVSAHVTLEQSSAPAASSYKAVFRVGHGCEGSATRAIHVFLPEGINGAKPMPKAGWSLAVKLEKLARPYDSHGKSIKERPAVVTWSGGRLLDSEYDEFILRFTLPVEPGVLRFRVLQQCERGQIDWAEVAVEGKTAVRYPAATLEVIPTPAGMHHH